MARKKPPEQVTGRYSALPHSVLDSIAFMGASHPAKALLCEVMRQHNGSNNGHLQLATSWLKARGWTSTGVIQRAKQELAARSLIVKTRQGGLNAGPDLWALTWYSISNYLGLDLRPGQYQAGAYHRLTPTPKKQENQSVKRSCAIPPDGPATAFTIPFNGTKSALLTTSAIPFNGNNVSTHVSQLRSKTKRIVGQPGKSGTCKPSSLKAPHERTMP